MRGILIFLCAAAMTLLSARAEEAGSFSAAGVLSGTTSTPEQCAATPGALWVVVEGRGDCIRYFADKLTGNTGTAIIWFEGDVLIRLFNTDGSPGKEVLTGEYASTSAEDLDRRAERVARDLGQPFVIVARPGTHGSSGDHKERRHLREIQLVEGALDQLKAKFGIQHVVLAGFAGGGHLVAALLSRRSDVDCAVTGSGAVAVRNWIEARGWSSDPNGFNDYWDPYDHVAEIPAEHHPRIIVIGDPLDSVVPIAVQTAYAERLSERGLDARLVLGNAADRRHHQLAATARQVAGWCAQGAPSEEIAKRLAGAIVASVPERKPAQPPKPATVEPSVLAAYAGNYQFRPAVKLAQIDGGPGGDLGLIFRPTGGEIRVLKTKDGSAAAQANIKAGDVITGINGKSIAGVPLRRVVNMLRRGTGARVRLSIKRHDVAISQDQTLEIAVRRPQEDAEAPALEVRVDVGKLLIEASGERPIFDFRKGKPLEAIAVSNTEFYVEGDYYTRLAFTADPSGKAQAVVLNPGRWEQKGTRGETQ